MTRRAGKAYLGAYDNVAAVGHANPEVVAAGVFGGQCGAASRDLEAVLATA